MIRRCKVMYNGVMCEGVYINGVVQFRIIDWLGRVKLIGCKYDEKVHTFFDDPIFDKRITLYREIVEWLRTHGARRFYKSVIHKSMPTAFGPYKTWCSHVADMLTLNILVRNRDQLTLGEVP